MPRMRSIAKSNDALLRYAVISLIAVALAAVTGRLAVHTVNDSPSYLNYPLGSLRDAMLSIRTPGYPILLALITGTLGLLWVPLAQVLLHATACWYLIEELLHRDMPVRSALLAGFCVLIGCTAADHINTISTDAPAASLGLIAAVALIAVYRTGRTSNLVLCATITSLAIFVRPAYLFLIPWIAIAGYLLGNQHRMITPSDDDRGRRRLQGVKIAI